MHTPALVVCSAVALGVVLSVHADDAQSQAVKTQVPYNGVARQAPVSLASDPGVTRSTGEVIVIHLDNTGVSDWTFINPRRAARVKAGVGVQFRNDTADRTFLVSIPVSIKTSDTTFRFPVLTRRPGFAETRRAYVDAALSEAATLPENILCVNVPPDSLDAIDAVQWRRELVRAFDPATMNPPDRTKFTDYAALIASAVGAADPQKIEEAAGKLPDAAKPLATRLRALANRLRGLSLQASPQTLSTALSPEDALQAMKRIYAHIAEDPKLEPSYRLQLDELRRVSDQPPSAAPALIGGGAQCVDNELGRIVSGTASLVDAYGRLYDLYTAPELNGTVAFTPERAAEAKRRVLADLDAQLGEYVAARKKNFDDRITVLLSADVRQRRNIRTWISHENRELARMVDARIDVRKRVLADLTTQGITDPETALKTALGNVDISQCASDETAMTCTASQLIAPNQTAIFTSEFIEAATPADKVFTFQARFFDEADVPSNSLIYLTRAEKPQPPPNSFVWNLVGSIGQKRDPAVATLTSPPAPTTANPDPPEPDRLCGTYICAEGHKNHFNGTGQVQLNQRVADYFQGSATIQFKQGDLGINNKDQNKDQTVTFSRYKFSIFAENGLALEYGKQPFASPSNGIAISEEGEGFRLIYSPMFLSGTYLMKRESEKFAADRPNRDSWAYIAQANNVPLSSALPFRSITVTYVMGKDALFPLTGAEQQPFEYRTYGADVSYAIPIVHLNGNYSFYTSERDTKDDSIECGAKQKPCNGRGRSAQLTMTRSFGLDAKNKPRRSVTLSAARGSGDRADTKTVDEGYVGETGGFAPDVIFLKTLLKPLNESYIRLDDAAILPALRFGVGIANKDYFGVTYVENAYSPLYNLVHDLFRVTDITSYSTTLKYHNYRLRRGDANTRGAGHELDVEFAIEGPKGVKTIVGGGYYVPGAATSSFITKNLWSVFSNVSLTFGQ